MLYGKSRKVLKALQFLCKDSGYTSLADVLVYLNNHILSEDFDGCIALLEQEGLIKTPTEEYGIPRYELTHLGKHYSEFRRAQIARFFMSSIVVPIVVALITTIITSAAIK